MESSVANLYEEYDHTIRALVSNYMAMIDQLAAPMANLEQLGHDPRGPDPEDCA